MPGTIQICSSGWLNHPWNGVNPMLLADLAVFSANRWTYRLSPVVALELWLAAKLQKHRGSESKYHQRRASSFLACEDHWV
jgi:hypothetical protein